MQSSDAIFPRGDSAYHWDVMVNHWSQLFWRRRTKRRSRSHQEPDSPTPPIKVIDSIWEIQNPTNDKANQRESYSAADKGLTNGAAKSEKTGVERRIVEFVSTVLSNEKAVWTLECGEQERVHGKCRMGEVEGQLGA
jgi:hypothetical protein